MSRQTDTEIGKGISPLLSRRLNRWYWAVPAGILTVIVVAGVVSLSAPKVRSSASGSPVGLARPKPPGDLFVSATNDGSVLVSWRPSLTTTVIGYRIYRASGEHGPYTILGAVNSPYIDTFTDSSDIQPGTTYAYTVTAFARESESTPIGPVLAVVLPASTPTPLLTPITVPTFAPAPPAALTAVARKPGRAAPKPLAIPTVGPATVPAIASPTALPTP